MTREKRNEFALICGAVSAVLVMAGFLNDYVLSPLNTSYKPEVVEIKKSNLRHFFEYKNCTENPLITGFVESVKVTHKKVKNKDVCHAEVKGWAWNDFALQSTRFGVLVNGKQVAAALGVIEKRDDLKKEYPCAKAPGFVYNYTPVGGHFDDKEIEIDLMTESYKRGDYLPVAFKRASVPKECQFIEDFNKFRLHNVKAIPRSGKLHDTKLVAIGYAPAYPAGSMARVVWKNKVTGQKLETVAKLSASRSRLFSSAIRSPANVHAWTVAAYLESHKDSCISPPDETSASVCH